MRSFEEQDEQAFLDLAWIEIDEVRALTPSNGPRTLAAVAGRILEAYGSFEQLAQARPAGLDLEWFMPCRRFQRNGFRAAEMLPPWLVPASDDERRFSPNTYLYVWEGVHSTLVYALQLLEVSSTWQPIEAVVSLVRPGA
jgi:hypothetical protein